MGFTIRALDAECKFASTLTVEALDHAIPQDAIHRALAQHGIATRRERKLTLDLTVWLTIALHLYPTVSIAGVVRKLARGLRFLWPDPTLPLPTDSAVAYRRAQLGAPPMVTLFKQVCQPSAMPQTRGAFRFGLRLMALSTAPPKPSRTPRPMPRWLAAIPVPAAPVLSRNFKACIWSSVARMRSSMLASGPATPASAWVASACCARWAAACCCCGTAAFTPSTWWSPPGGVAHTS